MESTNKSLLVLDQHALAERIAYERLIHRNETVASQQLIAPIAVDLTTEESGILEEFSVEINEI